MTEPTKDLDRLIYDAVQEEDAELLARFGEQTTSELFVEAFRGRRRLVALGGVVANTALFVAAVISASRFLDASDQRSMLIWAAATTLCVLAVMSIKAWYWIEMARLALARDIKRVELQVALLAKQLGEHSAR